MLYLFAFAFVFLLYYIYYGIFSFNNNFFNYLFANHRDHTQESIKERLRDRLKNCLTKNFHELHACFTIRLNLWKKIYVMCVMSSTPRRLPSDIVAISNKLYAESIINILT